LTGRWPAGPTDPPPPRPEPHVWLAELDAPGWPGAARLPAPERERAGRLRRAEDAARWTAARWALRTVLGRYLGEPPESIPLEPEEHGKPRLARDPERLCFNLSHSAGLALVAVARDLEVGVDVERVNPGRDVLALADRALDPEAAARVRAAAPGDRVWAFYAAWTAHEARLKCLGTGLGTRPGADPVALSALPVGEGYAATLAARSPTAAPPRLYSLAPSGSEGSGSDAS
jgi:4'-phosphopantetheinyl transferase